MISGGQGNRHTQVNQGLKDRWKRAARVGTLGESRDGGGSQGTDALDENNAVRFCGDNTLIYRDPYMIVTR